MNTIRLFLYNPFLFTGGMIQQPDAQVMGELMPFLQHFHSLSPGQRDIPRFIINHQVQLVGPHR